MINTYQTSLAPPPLPPRLSRSDTVLIQAPVPSPGHSKPLIRFLAGVVVLNLLVCVGGFILMYTTGNMVKKTYFEQKDHRYWEHYIFKIVRTNCRTVLWVRSPPPVHSFLKFLMVDTFLSVHRRLKRGLKLRSCTWTDRWGGADIYIWIVKCSFSMFCRILTLCCFVSLQKTAGKSMFIHSFLQKAIPVAIKRHHHITDEMFACISRFPLIWKAK